MGIAVLLQGLQQSVFEGTGSDSDRQAKGGPELSFLGLFPELDSLGVLDWGGGGGNQPASWRMWEKPGLF